MSNSVRRQIIDACLEMNQSDLNSGKSGNVSARVAGGMWITPSGIDYRELKPSNLVKLDPEGGYSGHLKPSSEWRMHVDIYRSFPDAGAVVHAHPPYVTALACQRRAIPAFHYMIAIAGGSDIRCAKYATFGTEALSRNMCKALENRSACLLANHGMICFGVDLKEAMWRAIEVETLARQYVLTLGIGEPRLLTKKQMDEAKEAFMHYGRQDS